MAQTITRKVLNEQLKTVWNLGVFYDCLNFESQIIHSKLWDKILDTNLKGAFFSSQCFASQLKKSMLLCIFRAGNCSMRSGMLKLQ